MLTFFFTQPKLWNKTREFFLLGLKSGGILHDIGNTTTILRFLHAEFAPQLTNRQNREFTAQLENLSNQIHEGQKMLSGFGLQSVVFSIAECVEECIELFHSHPLSQHCHISIEIQENYDLDGPPVVLTQALLNILQNSARALKNQTSKEIVITIARKKCAGILTINDNGPGFPKGYRVAPFSTYSKGTGLGLWFSLIQLRQYLTCTMTLSSPSQGGAQTDLYFWQPR